MKPLGVIEVYIALDSETQLRQTDIIFDFDVFVFQRPPETLHFCIIPTATSPIHADLNVVSLQLFNELIVCELAALVGIEDFRLAMIY